MHTLFIKKVVMGNCDSWLASYLVAYVLSCFV